MSYTITEDCTGCGACVRRCPVEAITGERKQRHTIDPELCIDCGACALVCPTQAILCPNGERSKPKRINEWLQPVWNYEACVLCRICVITCQPVPFSKWMPGTPTEFAPVNPTCAPPKTASLVAFALPIAQPTPSAWPTQK